MTLVWFLLSAHPEHSSGILQLRRPPQPLYSGYLYIISTYAQSVGVVSQASAAFFSWDHVSVVVLFPY